MTALIRYDAACKALAEAKAIDEVKDLLDKAEAMRHYMRQTKNTALELDAAEIRIRAERRLGEMLAEQKADGGLHAGGRPAAETGREARPVSDKPRLAEVGITKDMSSRSQKLAAVPDAVFEEAITDLRDSVKNEGARIRTNLLRAGDKALKGKKPKVETAPAVDTAELEHQIDELRAVIAELSANLDETLADNASMARVFESNDQVTAAMAEAKRFREENRILKERIVGLQNERNEYVRLTKSWKRKAESLNGGTAIQ